MKLSMNDGREMRLVALFTHDWLYEKGRENEREKGKREI